MPPMEKEENSVGNGLVPPVVEPSPSRAVPLAIPPLTNGTIPNHSVGWQSASPAKDPERCPTIRLVDARTCAPVGFSRVRGSAPSVQTSCPTGLNQDTGQRTGVGRYSPARRGRGRIRGELEGGCDGQPNW